MISVIVPVYNAEKHLPRCIESIQNQTYKDIELILIDDGSTDTCGEICDRYAGQDRRIRVFHTENGGVSAARNRGLEEAAGEYICFVDSDDYVGRDYVRILYDSVCSCNADIAFISTLEVTKEDTSFITSEDRRQEFDSRSAFAEMLKGERFTWGSPAKMYTQELARRICFPVGNSYDDFFTNPYLLEHCNRCVYSSSIQYYYYQRENSLTHSISEKSIRLWVRGMDKLFAYVEKQYPEYMELADRSFAINVTRVVIDRLLYDKDYKKWADRILKKYHNHFLNSLSISSLPLKTRGGVLLFLIHPHVYQIVRKNWIIRHKNVGERLRIKR